MKPFTELTMEQIKSNAPSIFQTQQKSGLSEHYVHIPTDRVINDMMALGWKPCQAVEIKAQQQLLENVKKAFADGAGEGITLENIGSKIEELDAKKKDQTKKFEEVSTLAGSAEKTVSDNKMKIAELAGRKAKRDERISANAKEAVITAVDTDWGFVIIGAGSNVGFTPQTKLLVKRDGVMIGRITPTSIEPSQTIGEVDRESLAPGVSFQVGDRVILAVPATR